MNEQSLFLRALDQPEGEMRRKWLERECDDLEQRARIAALLVRHENAGSFLEKPPVELQNETVERHRVGAEPQSDIAGSESNPRKLDKPITKSKFVERLIRSQLMTSDQVAECESTLASVQESSDARTYALAMVGANKLTGFQAKAIYDGRIKGLTFGEYIILDQLGKGGMGIVYRAKHRRMDRLVAIKVLPRFAMATKGLVDRFYREVKTAAKLMHPNIVAALDASEDDGLHYLVMEYVDGQDLGKVLKQSGPLPIEQAIDCVIQAARGLQFAHEQGVVHRDIKPANLLLDHHDTVKILDMGLARLTSAPNEDVDQRTDNELVMPCSNDQARSIDNRLNLSLAEEAATIKDDTRLTLAGEVMGTLDYMPPEQFTDTRNVDERGDIYSLGCTLYRLLTGERPFPAETLGAIFHAHLHAPIPSLRSIRPDVDECLDHVFQRMLSKQPDQRPSSMTQVIKELEESRNVAKPPQAIPAQAESQTDADRTFDPSQLDTSWLDTSARVESTSAPRIRSYERREQRKSVAGWIILAGVTTALLIIGAMVWLPGFADSQRNRIASNAGQTGVDSVGTTPNNESAPNPNRSEIQESPSSQPRTESDTTTERLLPEESDADPWKDLVENEASHDDAPETSDDPAAVATISDDMSMESETPPEPPNNDQQDRSTQNQNEPGPTNALPWSGGFTTWFGGLNQGDANPFANRTFEFNDNGQRVSISQNSEGITVSIDGRVVQAATPAELKKRDAKAFAMFEKVFGLPGFNANPANSARDLQRQQLERLREKHAGNPQLRSLIERMLRDTTNQN